MRLNIGCGNRRLPGYTGVDLSPNSAAADIFAPADDIPLADACADEVMVIHLVEHLYPWDLPHALAEWARLLKSGGKLVIEAPDLIKCCLNLIEGRRGKHPNQMGLWGIYGDDRAKDPLMMHRYGYTFASLAPLVETAGFHGMVERTTVFHATGREHRDFRMEAIRR